jgi:hypothetical protein
VDKQLAIVVYCFCRQAERSIDSALSSSEQWLRLVDYYAGTKRDGLNGTLDRLKSLGAAGQLAGTRDSVFQSSFASWLRAFIVRPLNHLRSSWYFSKPELAFLYATLAKFVEHLRDVGSPQPGQLIDLRMDLLSCQWIIQRRMGKLPGLEKATNIEHFGQSDYVAHATLEECGVGPLALQQ